MLCARKGIFLSNCYLLTRPVFVSPIASAPSASASASVSSPQSQSQQQSSSSASADSAAPGLAPRLSISSKRVSQPVAVVPTPTPMVLGLAATSRPSDGWPSSSTGMYYTTVPYYRGNGSAGATVSHYTNTASSTSGYSTNTEYGASARVRSQSSATPYGSEVVAGTVVGSGPTKTMLIPVADPSPVPEFGSVPSSPSEVQRSQVSTSILRGRPDRSETSAPGERPRAGAGAGLSLSAQTSNSEPQSAPLATSTLLASPMPYPGVSSTRTTTTAELEDGWISTSTSPNANKRPMSRAFDSSTNASPLPTGRGEAFTNPPRLLATTNSNYLGGMPPIATIHSTGITRQPPSKPSGLPDPTNPAITLIRLARSELIELETVH